MEDVWNFVVGSVLCDIKRFFFYIGCLLDGEFSWKYYV